MPLKQETNNSNKRNIVKNPNVYCKPQIFHLFQIMRTRKDALEGKALPADFRLSPTRGRSGPRAAWGGEIGGPKISEQVLNMSPAAGEIQVSQNSMRLDSAATSASLGSASIEIRSFDSWL